MQFDADRVLINVRAATTDDLLDRATVYRGGMEPEALALIDAELAERGVTAEAIAEHARRRGKVQTDAAGAALECSRCRKPAIAIAWGWHRLWGWAPLFPRRFRYCAEHVPGSAKPPNEPS